MEQSLNPAQVMALITFVIVCVAVVMVIVSNTRKNK
jgi:hypothetical protein